MNTHTEGRCLRCEKKLDHSKSVWLELNMETNRYHSAADPVPGEKSQGAFEFGADCAAAILKNDGIMVRIGRAAA